MSIKKIKILAFLLAVLIVSLDYLLENKPQPSKSKTVYVLKESIPKGTVINEEHIEEKEIQNEFFPLDLCLTKEDFIHREVQVALSKGSYLQKSFFEREDRYKLSEVIPEGYEAISIGVNEYSGVAFFIRPQDRVKIIHIDETKKESILLEDVLVLAVDRYRSDEAQPELYSTLTVALKPNESKKVLKAQANGELYFALQKEERSS